MGRGTKLLSGVVCVFISLTLMFYGLGRVERTDTAPLTMLTLTQPGCEYVFRAGIAGEVRNGICSIEARYRMSSCRSGGTIEVPGGWPIEISAGQVVGTNQLDDGSNEPWSAERKYAVATLLAGFALAICSLFIMRSPGR